MRWNVSQFVRDPDTGKHKRRRRPKADWVEHQEEALRLISDDLFLRAQARTRAAANSDKRLKSGGRAKYLLSGLLVCNVCKAHYVIADARSYACSGHWNGRACSNHIRVRRDAVERVVLGGLRRDLLAPDRVERMANEMRAAYAERARKKAAQAETLPHEVDELDARIARLRDRLKSGDPTSHPTSCRLPLIALKRSGANCSTRARSSARTRRCSQCSRELRSDTANRSTRDLAVISKRRPKPARSCETCWAKSCFHPARTAHSGRNTQCSLRPC
jgi:site-specific DNA recombinase